MAAFSFAYNPFVVLPVSLRASAREVEEAFQRRLAARPQDEASLTRARRLLLEPDSRLAAEVSWLIDVGQREAVTLLGAMAGGNQAALLDALAGQPALSKANVAADACARMKSIAFIRPLAQAQRDLSAGAIASLINEIHAAIPIPDVAPRQVGAALGAMTMLHAGAALEAISAQPDPAAAFASVTQGPDAPTGAFLQELTAQYQRRYPEVAPEAANDMAPAAGEAAANDVAAVGQAAGGAFAEVHAVGEQGWGEGSDAHAAAATAFMDAQLIFSSHDRFDTWGNSRRVRRVLYFMGGGLAAVILVYLVFGKGPPDNDNTLVDPPNYAEVSQAPPPPPAPEHRKKECINVSGASYCTQ